MLVKKNPFWLLLAFWACLIINAMVGLGMFVTWGMVQQQFGSSGAKGFEFFALAILVSCFVDVIAYWLLIKRRAVGLYLKFATALLLVAVMFYPIIAVSNYHVDTLALALSPLAWPIVVALIIRKEPAK